MGDLGQTRRSVGQKNRRKDLVGYFFSSPVIEVNFEVEKTRVKILFQKGVCGQRARNIFFSAAGKSG